MSLQAGSLDDQETTTSYKTAPDTPGICGEKNFDRIFEEEEILNLRESVSRNEERAVRAEQELEMVSMELKLCQEGYARELESLKMDKVELQEKLLKAVTHGENDSSKPTGQLV